MASNTIKTEYIKAKGENRWLQCQLYYSLGGINYFTYKTEARGYYVSVTPVERSPLNGGGYMIGFTAFSGVKRCVVECKRRGGKAEQEALRVYEAHKAELLALFEDQIDKEAEVA